MDQDYGDKNRRDQDFRDLQDEEDEEI